VTSEELRELGRRAWAVRQNAHVVGTTKVGCALLTSDGSVFVGCNVEHKFRSHDVHAEVNAISSMVAGGQRKIVALVVVAERERFTPCGACMDWIMQFGSDECVVGFQAREDGQVTTYTAKELMPHYPM